LLGVAEAGFFPGMILYFTYWFPKAYRARVISARFFLPSPSCALLSGVIAYLAVQSTERATAPSDLAVRTS
jgi:ACS family tartrate transporter-like MFS transporter